MDEMRGPGRNKTQLYHPSYLSLMKSAENGCHLCRIMWDVFVRETEYSADPRLCVSELHPGAQLALRSLGLEVDHIQIFAAESTSTLTPIALDSSRTPTASDVLSKFPDTRREHHNLFDYKLDVLTYAGRETHSYLRRYFGIKILIEY